MDSDTIREIIENAEALGDLPAATCLLREWEDGNLIPADEHLNCVADAIAAAERRGMERAAVICDEMVNHDAWDCAAAIRADLEDKE